MKILRKFLLLLTLAFTLASCAGDTIAGKYSFQLGKTGGTNFSIEIDLQDKVYPEDPQPAQSNKKVFTFIFNMATEEKEGTEADKIVDNYLKFTGFYYPVKKPSGDTQIRLGVVYAYSLFEQEVEEIINDESRVEIPAELIELIIYATYVPGKITITFPVSLNDLYYQLYWYGYKLVITETEFNIIEAPLGKHELGTHPTEKEVAQIKELEKGDSGYRDFRDFHTVPLGLMKE